MRSRAQKVAIVMVVGTIEGFALYLWGWWAVLMFAVAGGALVAIVAGYQELARQEAAEKERKDAFDKRP